jgi:hypothetical protein
VSGCIGAFAERPARATPLDRARKSTARNQAVKNVSAAMATLDDLPKNMHYPVS